MLRAFRLVGFHRTAVVAGRGPRGASPVGSGGVPCFSGVLRGSLIVAARPRSRRLRYWPQRQDGPLAFGPKSSCAAVVAGRGLRGLQAGSGGVSHFPGVLRASCRSHVRHAAGLAPWVGPDTVLSPVWTQTSARATARWPGWCSWLPGRSQLRPKFPVNSDQRGGNRRTGASMYFGRPSRSQRRPEFRVNPSQ